MFVYGGYQFPGGNDTTEGNGSGSLINQYSSPQLLRYNLKLQLWEAVISSSLVQPEPRYGHSSVVYNVRGRGWGEGGHEGWGREELCLAFTL